MSFRSVLALPLAGLLVTAASPASAQNDWFGGGGGGASQAQQQQAQTNLRLQQLEQQIRALNGQIEQLSFQNRQLQDQMRRMQQDYDLRLQDLESGRGGKPAGQPPQRRSDLPTEAPAPAAPGAVAAAPPPAVPPAAAPAAPLSGPGAPPQVLGQIPVGPGGDPIGGIIAGQPLDLGALATGQRPAAAPPGVDRQLAAVPPVPDARAEYDAAYTYVLNGEYDLSVASFTRFIENHPTDRRVGSAFFWLGESFAAKGMNREAADAYLKSYTQYPDDPKAPDALFKLGMSLNGMGEKQAACSTFAEFLTKYPRASRTLRERATAERTRARCA